MFKSINGGILPQRATKYSAGFDVYANEDVVIGAGETKLIGLGIAIDLTKFCFPTPDIEEWKSMHYLELHIRSSLRVKGLTSLGTGIIDIDYPDEIKMVVHNPISYEALNAMMVGHKNHPFKYKINKGDKIGQLILKRHEGYLMPKEYTLDIERTGGFGSSGK